MASVIGFYYANTSEQDACADSETSIEMHRLFITNNGSTHFDGKALLSKKMSSIMSHFSNVICPPIKMVSVLGFFSTLC